MAIFKGAGVAIVTPMKDNEEVNYDKLEELVNWQIDEGTDAIIIAGTTGESSTLTMEEHRQVIEAAVEFTKHRVPVVAGTGSNCTRTAIQLSQEAEEAGVDGLLIVTPYYNKATQAGLVGHFKAVADSVKIPIILYNVPSRTGCNIKPETVAAICKEASNVVGIKEASGDLSQVAMLMSIMDGRLDLYSGNDDQIVPIMSLGGKGVISVTSNLMPGEKHDEVALFNEGKIAEALAIQAKILAFEKALFMDVNPIPVKEALNIMGFKAGECRLPLCSMSEEQTAKLRSAMEPLGLVGKIK